MSINPCYFVGREERMNLLNKITDQDVVELTDLINKSLDLMRQINGITNNIERIAGYGQIFNPLYYEIKEMSKLNLIKLWVMI